MAIRLFRICSACCVLCLILLLSGCGRKNEVAPSVPNDADVADSLRIPVAAVELPRFEKDLFTKRVEVVFSGSTVPLFALPQGVEAVVDGADVVIKSSVPGVEYCLSGSSDNGSVTIVSDFSPLVTLKGLSLSAMGRNTLQVSSREVIYLRCDGDAVLSDKPGREKAPKNSAVLKFMGRSVLLGDGSLRINAGRRSGIYADDTICIAGAGLKIASQAGNALAWEKALCVYEGSVDAAATKDVLKSKGDIYLYGGRLSLASSHSKADGLQVAGFYQAAGAVVVNVSGDAADGIKAKADCVIAGGTMQVQASGNALFAEKKDDYSSSSCIKCSSALSIYGGELSLTSLGDGAKGISGDGNIAISGGNVKVVTKGNDVNHPVDINAHASCKGIKSDGDLWIAGGNVEVLVLGKGERAEGAESKGKMWIGGDAELYIYAYDDAINAGTSLVVDGGSTFAYSVMNDAVDSNGRVEVNAGLLVADGAYSPEQGIDTDNPADFVLRGGVLLSVGGSMGFSPCLPLGRETVAPLVSWSGLSLKTGDYATISDNSGKALLSYRLARDIEDASLLFSVPGMESDERYTLSLSKDFSGGESLRKGLYKDGTPLSVYESMDFVQEALLSVVRGREVRSIDPDTFDVKGMMSPPPPPPGHHAVDGPMPPPPPPGMPFGKGGMPQMGDGSFPPPPPNRNMHADRVDMYDENNLPNR